MTAKGLANYFAKTFGFKTWPETYEVDAETYGKCCQVVFDQALEAQFPRINHDFVLEIAVGKNNGLMFKNVELILEGHNDGNNRQTR